MITLHADVVGSLLRPAELLAAQKQLAAGTLSNAQFKEIEDRAVDAAIAAANKPGLYRRILQERCRIAFAVNDAVVDPADRPLLVQAWRFDHYLSPSDMPLVEKVTNTSVGSLDDLETP